MPNYGAANYSYDPEAAYGYANNDTKQELSLTIIIESTVIKSQDSSLNHIACAKCDNKVLLKNEFKAEDDNYYCATCWEQWTREHVLAPAGLGDV
ncbi:unnamed protein product [marine sediment metagenome]|uniref:Uncharacterized protein n=1 Tax=marine sediment metagenome TaxID=412755 RepID=X0WM88_9ZZZZ